MVKAIKSEKESSTEGGDSANRPVLQITTGIFKFWPLVLRQWWTEVKDKDANKGNLSPQADN